MSKQYIWMVGLLFSMQPMTTQAISLQEAMNTAAKTHPLLQMAEKNMEAVEQQGEDMKSYAYNPEVSFRPQQRRLKGGGSTHDWYLTVTQGVEINGKQSLREQVAQAALQTAQQEQNNTRQQLMAQAAKAYVSLYFAKQRFDLRQQQSDMLSKVRQAMLQKMKLGQANQLDVNLAQSAFASAINATNQARQAWVQSRQQYAQALGLGEMNDEDMYLPELDTHWAYPRQPYALALSSRADVQALQARASQTEAQSELADASRTADITLAAMVAREAGDQLLAVDVTVPFSIWNDHSGAYRASLATQERADMQLEWAKQQLRYAVDAALNNERHAMQALQGVQSQHMQSYARDTIRFARQAYDAGELDLEALVVHVRQGLDAQITTLNMIEQAWMARITLAQVLGHPEFILQGTQP